MHELLRHVLSGEVQGTGRQLVNGRGQVFLHMDFHVDVRQGGTDDKTLKAAMNLSMLRLLSLPAAHK